MGASPIPPVLHKLVPARYGKELLPFLDEGWIRFTQPNALNDPFEVRGLSDQTNYLKELDHNIAIRRARVRLLPLDSKQRIRQQLVCQIAYDSLAKEICDSPDKFKFNILQRVEEGRNRDYGILSLTNAAQSSALWSHYADRHRGIAIGFNTKTPEFRGASQEGLRTVQKVEYFNELISIDLCNSSIDNIANPFYRKTPEWSYESEWRIVVRFPSLSSRRHKVAEKPDRENHLVHLVKIRLNAVVEIRLGALADVETEARVLEFARTRKVKVYRMKLSAKTYGLDEVRIN